MFYEVGSLCVGLLFLIYGSDWTVSSATVFAQLFGVSTLFVGVTIVVIGSSIPEIATSIYGSVYGTEDFVVAHIVGSATSQITLGIGILAFTTALTFERETVSRYGTGMLVAMTVMLVGVWIGRISRFAGVLMIVIYLGFLAFRFEQTITEWHSNTGSEAVCRGPVSWSSCSRGWRWWFWAVTCSSQARRASPSNWVRRGTCSASRLGSGRPPPEIAIGVSSMYRDEQSVGVGTLLGSNITDPLFSLGAGAAVGTIALEDPEVAVLGTAYMLVASAAVLLLAYRRRSFGRYEGAVCVVLYVPTFLFG